PGVEREHAIELADVDEDAVGRERLRAHRVAASGDAYRAALAARCLECRAHPVEVARLDDAIDARRIELRMDVVHDNARVLRAGKARPRRGEPGDLEELAAVQAGPQAAFWMNSIL